MHFNLFTVKQQQKLDESETLHTIVFHLVPMATKLSIAHGETM